MGASIFIHYGTAQFIPCAMSPIGHSRIMPKPTGGLWASREHATFGWKEWCEENGFCVEKLRESFRFQLTPDTRILTISSQEDLEPLPHIKSPMDVGWQFLDFVALAQEYDAIEVIVSQDCRLLTSLYGWDCDSILIMSSDAVVPIS